MEVKMKTRILLYAVMFLVFVSYIFPQTNNSIVCETETTTAPGATTWGKYKPAQTATGEYFRILIVYAQFASDTQTDTEWPLNYLPNWANSFIAGSVSSSYADQTISDYFDEASLGKFDFIGDVYQDTIIIPTDMHYSNANKYVIDELNDNISDFSRYDNWKLENGNHVFSEGNGDGYLDMLIIIYRNAGSYFGLAGGIALLGISEYITHDNIKINGSLSSIGSGITTRGGLGGKFGMVGHLAHEFGHYLFGGGHLNFGGLMVGLPWTHATGTYMMNAWERTWLGYLTPTVPTADGEKIILGDFVTTGNSIKIPIPFNNPNSSTFFIIENHQRTSIYDQIMCGETLNGNWNLTTTLGSGIYVWVITNGNNWTPTLDIKAADGAWDWIYDGDYYAGPGWHVGQAWEGYLPKTKRTAVNRNTGKSDRFPRHIVWNGIWSAKWVDINPLTGQYELTRDVMGEENDAFNKDYNELLTPWSNPSSYVTGYGQTDISIQLVDENAGVCTVKVFSTEASALDLPPSKPQNLSVSPSQNNHPYATWDANQEPDVISGGYYNVWKKKFYNGAWHWDFLAQTTNNYYEDSDETYCPGGQNCAGETNIYYRVTAVDNQLKESVPSDSVVTKVTGFFPYKTNLKNPNSLNTTEYSLVQNYPNPFNPVTVISYEVTDESIVQLKIYDILGREVAELVNESKLPGTYQVNFDANDLASGVYIYRIVASRNERILFTDTKQMILLR